MWHVLHLWPKDRVYLKIYKSVCADRCCQILIVTSSQKCISSWPFITLTHSTRRERNQSLIEKASIFCIMSFFTRSRDLSDSHDDRFPGCKTRFKSRFHLDRQISAQIREKCRRRVKGYQRLKFLHGQDMEGKCIEHLRRRFLSQVQCARDTSKWEWVFVAATFSTLSLTTKHLKNSFISSQPLSLPSTFFFPLLSLCLSLLTTCLLSSFSPCSACLSFTKLHPFTSFLLPFVCRLTHSLSTQFSLATLSSFLLSSIQRRFRLYPPSTHRSSIPSFFFNSSVFCFTYPSFPLQTSPFPCHHLPVTS